MWRSVAQIARRRHRHLSQSAFPTGASPSPQLWGQSGAVGMFRARGWRPADVAPLNWQFRRGMSAALDSWRLTSSHEVQPQKIVTRGDGGGAVVETAGGQQGGEALLAHMDKVMWQFFQTLPSDWSPQPSLATVPDSVRSARILAKVQVHELFAMRGGLSREVHRVSLAGGEGEMGAEVAPQADVAARKQSSLPRVQAAEECGGAPGEDSWGRREWEREREWSENPRPSSGAQEREAEEERRRRRERIGARHANFYRLLRKQLAMERSDLVQAAAKYKQLTDAANKKQLGAQFPFGQRLIHFWYGPVTAAVRQEQEKIKTSAWVPGDVMAYRNYSKLLLGLDPEVLAVLVCHKLVELMLSEQGKASGSKGGASGRGGAARRHAFVASAKKYLSFVKMITAAKAVGEAVELEKKVKEALASIKKSKKRTKVSKTLLPKHESDSDTPPERVRTKGRALSVNEAKTLMQKDRDGQQIGRIIQGALSWEPEESIQVGAILIELFLKSAKTPWQLMRGKRTVRGGAEEGEVAGNAVEGEADLSDDAPAMVHDYVYFSMKQHYGAVCCSVEMKAVLDHAGQDFLGVLPYMPMLVRPRKWTHPSKGAHLFLQSSLMRTHGAKDQKVALSQAGDGLGTIYKALDVLGSTPWRINRAVKAVIEELWEQGGGVGNLVLTAKEPIPDLPEGSSKEEVAAHKKVKRELQKLNAEKHSLTSDMNLKLKVARLFLKEERFYYPHNLDFRGRAYPMHPHLNHLGADPSRGMLEFAEGRPLGKTGLRWLKIQIANLMGGGVDKFSFDNRVQFVDDNWGEVEDSAKRPLGGRRWWLQAEDPFQCLAACMEVVAAVEGGEGEAFVSHLPVHQDGSCNGLQHYAALGRDVEGARSVNMCAIDAPADVYTRIAKIVDRLVREDASGEDPKKEALILLGQVDRKLVKQTVMTSVYGVTFVGARAQILSRLKERGVAMNDLEAYKAANYAAKTTISALTEMFESARAIMAWLAECAKLVASDNRAVEWQTPLGLPVVQPYRMTASKQVRTTLQCISFSDPNQEKVAIPKQKSAFPPNFIHSLDSSHMMATALKCHQKGLAFAGVHDSFWTHAGSVEEMNRILREEFVGLHSEPILERLLEHFKKEFPYLDFPPVPKRGDLELKDVLKADYFFN